MAKLNANAQRNAQIDARGSLIVGDDRYFTTYEGTAEALIAAGIVNPCQLPGIGHSNRQMATFYRGQPVSRGGWCGGKRVEEDSHHLAVCLDYKTGLYRVRVGKDRPEKDAAFKGFMGRTLAPVDLTESDSPLMREMRAKWDHASDVEVIRGMHEELVPLGPQAIPAALIGAYLILRMERSAKCRAGATPQMESARPKSTGAVADDDRDWTNTPREEWHTLPDSSLLNFLFVGLSMRDEKAGRAPLDYSIDTQVVQLLQGRAEKRERG